MRPVSDAAPAKASQMPSSTERLPRCATSFGMSSGLVSTMKSAMYAVSDSLMGSNQFAFGEPRDDGDEDERDGEHRDRQHRDGAPVVALAKIEHGNRNGLGARREQQDGRRQLADGAHEDEDPGGDHAVADERRGDVDERAQPRGAEDAARVLE